GLERFQLSFEHDRKTGSTCQVFYAYDLWNYNRLVALKFINNYYIDSYVSRNDLLTLQTLQNYNYMPKDVIYNRCIKNIDDKYVPIEQYVGELGRLCQTLPINRCIENGAKHLPEYDCYVIAFEYVEGQTVWENLVRTDFIYLNEIDAKQFVKLFISNIVTLLNHHLIHFDLNTNNYFYKFYDFISERSKLTKYSYNYQYDNGNEDGYFSMNNSRRNSNYSDISLNQSLMTFIDFGWSNVQANEENDKDETLLRSIQNLFDRTPKVLQLFTTKSYWDFRRAVISRKYGL
ncbi:unnamed protein product, partial [Didymodactylos carnosus]